jgi:hypothetical protein
MARGRSFFPARAGRDKSRLVCTEGTIGSLAGRDGVRGLADSCSRKVVGRYSRAKGIYASSFVRERHAAARRQKTQHENDAFLNDASQRAAEQRQGKPGNTKSRATEEEARKRGSRKRVSRKKDKTRLARDGRRGEVSEVKTCWWEKPASFGWDTGGGRSCPPRPSHWTVDGPAILASRPQPWEGFRRCARNVVF